MSKQVDPQNVDRRLAKRLIMSGQLDEADYQKYIKSLPDLADKAEVANVESDDDSESEE